MTTATVSNSNSNSTTTTTTTTTGPTATVRFNHLPRDVVYTIASKLPPKEIGRTSVLSREWRRMWQTTWPVLAFDDAEACRCRGGGGGGGDDEPCQEYMCAFTRAVSVALWKHGNKVVETIRVKAACRRFVVDDDGPLAHPADFTCCYWVDTCVRFALASRTKNLALDLMPTTGCGLVSSDAPRYRFPFHLFDDDDGGGEPPPPSCLHNMHLCYVSLLYPPHSAAGLWFPNLRKLHLALTHAMADDLQRMLSHCRRLEWFHLDCCSIHGGGELTVATPLPHLLYLSATHCEPLTKLEFNAANLATFEYAGSFATIHLVHSLKLQSANIEYDYTESQHTVLVPLLKGIPSIRNLTLRFTIASPYPEKHWLRDMPFKFSNLRHLQLAVNFFERDVDKILYSSACFLRVTPFIEKLEVHYFGIYPWSVQSGPCREDLGQCELKYLKNVWITGFKAARGQLEFLLHVVENAHALEVVRVYIDSYPRERYWFCRETALEEEAKEIARTHLMSAIRSRNVTIDLD